MMGSHSFHLRSLAKDEHGDAVSETHSVRGKVLPTSDQFKAWRVLTLVGSVEAGPLCVLHV